jgi:PII-like signaling protein
MKRRVDHSYLELPIVCCVVDDNESIKRVRPNTKRFLKLVDNGKNSVFADVVVLVVVVVVVFSCFVSLIFVYCYLV